MKRLALCLGMLSPMAALAQPGSDVWLLDLVDDYGNIRLENPVNISHNTGYDNQPYFLPNGGGILFASQIDGGQVDILRYDLET